MSRVFLALLVAFVAPSDGRTASAPLRSIGDRAQYLRRVQERIEQRTEKKLQELRQKFSARSSTSDVGEQPVFAGSWKSQVPPENIDAFLDRAMGVSYLKRKIAAKASQTQKLYQRGKVVHLEITDRRGTMKYEMFPDGRTVAAKGFMKLPCKQRVVWGKDGSLQMTESYSQCLGDADPNPVVRSSRGVTKNGEMLVVVERTLVGGEVIQMRTRYKRLAEKAEAAAFVGPPLRSARRAVPSSS